HRLDREILEDNTERPSSDEVPHVTCIEFGPEQCRTDAENAELRYDVRENASRAAVTVSKRGLRPTGGTARLRLLFLLVLFHLLLRHGLHGTFPHSTASAEVRPQGKEAEV